MSFRRLLVGDLVIVFGRRLLTALDFGGGVSSGILGCLADSAASALEVFTTDDGGHSSGSRAPGEHLDVASIVGSWSRLAGGLVRRTLGNDASALWRWRSLRRWLILGRFVATDQEDGRKGKENPMFVHETMIPILRKCCPCVYHFE